MSKDLTSIKGMGQYKHLNNNRKFRIKSQVALNFKLKMGYLYLLIAITGEVIGTTYLKSTNSFSELIPSIYVIIGYGTAFYFMMLAMKTIPITNVWRWKSWVRWSCWPSRILYDKL